ncbi:DUF1543 domain-containing protein [Mucilaginibacter achroorhodeus]|uniref:DUF1543 domain-containing protein n=1 Tax=Mucilaginibacter achroorhodeus TaxID=2599294 RepID=A0A563U4E5_9SPHI|nr:DUF1543 domain-containing protein [Mucilaginibacter achroorhodeus]TWR26211.1 DUF1543 domain-containing protein [Mucilaginibacter achroorhodeus]
MNQQPSTNYKLFMLLLGSKAPARNVEQHDFFFGIATSLKELIPEIKAFWPEAGKSLHIDGWREVNSVDGYGISITEKIEQQAEQENKLFFINLGGYKGTDLVEQHYTLLSVHPDQGTATQEAKKTIFFKTNSIANGNRANAHVDDKYGIDVDEIYRIEDILAPHQKAKFQINITPNANPPEDEVHLGYFKLDKILKGE